MIGNFSAISKVFVSGGDGIDSCCLDETELKTLFLNSYRPTGMFLIRLLEAASNFFSLESSNMLNILELILDKRLFISVVSSIFLVTSSDSMI